MPHSPMELRFSRDVKKALERAELVLAKNKVPVLAKDAPHKYDDKYLVVEHAVNNGLAALKTSLASLGLDEEGLEAAQTWVRDGKAVSLRMEASRKCKFLATEERKQDSGSEHVTKFMGMTSSSKTVHTIIEHKWEIQHAFRIVLFCGANPEPGASVVLAERTGAAQVTTTGREKQAPEPDTHAFPERNVNVTNFFSALDKNGEPTFAIDRTLATCHTPARNEDTERVQTALINLSTWCVQVKTHFENDIFKYVDDLNRASFQNAEDLFVPVLPTLQRQAKAAPTAMSDDDQDEADEEDTFGAVDAETEQVLLREHKADIDKWLETVRGLLPTPDGGAQAGLATTLEASVCKLMEHMRTICKCVYSSCLYTETMLHDQLVEAIGKEVTAQDVAEYMQYHYRRLFSDEIFRPFSYDIKRPGFAPEGSLSVEHPDKAGAAEIATCVQVRRPNDEDHPAVPMHFKLSAATSVEMQGPQFCHGYMAHRFSNETRGQTVNLVARARQFSSFVLLVGKIAAKDEFAPEHAIILRNKDCAIIPLLLDPLPSAKAFRDAIESLSPEQQAFAKAMRAMQLASTLFAVAVVEIKPQLELLLKLPPGSLTKEIALTQDLMRLFIEFQVPCDLVTYDGPAETATPAEKVSAVKGHVKALLDMMEAERKAKVAEEADRARDLAYQQGRFPGYEDDDAEADFDAANEIAVAKRSSGRGGGRGGGRAVRMMKKSGISFGGPPQEASAAGLYGGGPSVRGFGGGGFAAGGGGFGAAPQMAMMASAPPPRAMASPMAPPAQMQQQQQQQQQPQQQQQQQKPQQQQQQQEEVLDEESGDAMDGGAVDYTRLPAQMDATFEALDRDAALRSTKIKVKDAFRMETYDSPWMSRSKSVVMRRGHELKEYRNKAMDLLDALSRSGELPLVETQLHIVVATTHCFDTTIMSTLIEKNINPIERIERSSLLVASSITGRPIPDLLAPGHQQRIQDGAPQLFDRDAKRLKIA